MLYTHNVILFHHLEKFIQFPFDVIFYSLLQTCLIFTYWLMSPFPSCYWFPISWYCWSIIDWLKFCLVVILLCIINEEFCCCCCCYLNNKRMSNFNEYFIQTIKWYGYKLSKFAKTCLEPNRWFILKNSQCVLENDMYPGPVRRNTFLCLLSIFGL